MNKMGKIQMFCNSLHDDAEHCVQWAIKNVEEGKDSTSLKALSEMQPLYNDDEVRLNLRAALKELNLEVLGPKEAVLEFAKDILTDTVEDTDLIGKNIHKLRKLCINNDYPDELIRFYDLSFAYDDLVKTKSKSSESWPKATRENIEDIILEECKKGL